jgi:hypothetical protein
VTRLRGALVVVALLAGLAAGVGITVPATYGGQAAVDEPEYLLSALSLWEDRDLDISDELAERRFVPYHDSDLPIQAQPRADGSQVSPHDPLLPVLLAVPVGLGGWVAAKLTLAGLAAILAALVLWVAVRRLDVPLRIAAPGVALAFCSAPLAVYGQQVYPELPAALAVTAAVAAMTGTRHRTGLTTGLTAAAITALPWLSVKYVPVAAVLTLLALRRTNPKALLGILAGAGAAYLLVHRLVYGGWTVYASGDHFQGSGEFGVVGFQPDYAGRTTRLLGLLVDRDFGLGAWQPAWLLLVPAAAALLRTRPADWTVLAVPLAAGWATATWVALTMHGFWWPGRQTVVVLPLALLAILIWARDHAKIAAGAAVVGVVFYVNVLTAKGTTWVLSPDDLRLHWPMGHLLPDDRDLAPIDKVKYAVWVAIAAVATWRTVRPAPRTGRPADPAPAEDRTSRSAGPASARR